MSKDAKPAKKNLGIHLFAGGIAGCCEALTCHPLDTIKVRLQLRGERQAKRPLTTVAGQAMDAAAAAVKKPPSQNFISVGVQIARKEGVLSLYKGLGAVVTGIVPKMAIRFSSFEYFKGLMADKKTGQVSAGGNFMAGLAAGTTEAVLVVTPMDVIKIRLQAQRHSMTDPLDVPKYRNAAHCVYVMVKEEGAASLYKGVGLTALRQATNQAANFTVYQYLRKALHDAQPQHGDTLPAYQHLLMGFVSGACGPLFNAPIDTIKTRIQKSASTEKGFQRFLNVTRGIITNEGYAAFYKGLTPRVLRVAPGQAITFMVYERVYKWMVSVSESIRVEDYSESSSTTEA
ncbi:hypothetical protein PhCBS80983_g04949 [Powellomyces hirtus]|uniref:Succinate/fumarate mitochondrial transporter n=1 Tax=Powellomyces hirtus TaxID=109895 RepID=A0A507DXH0_9FUNG|nr:mitochondrial carrier domain-containing protein [Powellomyces hirtus]TPX55877.1 hypothetical protein PhCBS80983_g04949 [Powellomyces hirtus]